MYPLFSILFTSLRIAGPFNLFFPFSIVYRPFFSNSMNNAAFGLKYLWNIPSSTLNEFPSMSARYILLLLPPSHPRNFFHAPADLSEYPNSAWSAFTIFIWSRGMLSFAISIGSLKRSPPCQYAYSRCAYSSLLTAVNLRLLIASISSNAGARTSLNIAVRSFGSSPFFVSSSTFFMNVL